MYPDGDDMYHESDYMFLGSDDMCPGSDNMHPGSETALVHHIVTITLCTRTSQYMLDTG